MDEMNFAQARHNMIEQQIRPWTVLDPDVLDVLASLPRDEFVPAAYRRLAYADTRVPLAHGQEMMPPVVEGRMLQAAEILREDRILEVGTGTGYITACLARLGAHVDSVDIHEDFVQAAGKRLEACGIDNVSLHAGDAARGWSGGDPWDVIVLTGAVPEVPAAYREALAPGGRLFAIVGEEQHPIMEAVRITRIDTNEWARESLFETWIAVLENAQRPPRFDF
jgi:protein-L-isoaspartate(D-aspartate) O-methyltransferase